MKNLVSGFSRNVRLSVASQTLRLQAVGRLVEQSRVYDGLAIAKVGCVHNGYIDNCEQRVGLAGAIYHTRELAVHRPSSKSRLHKFKESPFSLIDFLL